MNVSIHHFPLVIDMLLFPDLARVDVSGPCEVFARISATTVDLLAETWQPGENKVDGNLSDMTLSNRSIR